MCDYSLHLIASRPARVGDKLISTSFPHIREVLPRRTIATPSSVCFPAPSLPSRKRFDARLAWMGWRRQRKGRLKRFLL